MEHTAVSDLSLMLKGKTGSEMKTNKRKRRGKKNKNVKLYK